jgi:hypothetical protein
MKEEAQNALREVVPDLDRYLTERSIEIFSHDEWYLQGDEFDRQRVMQSWKNILTQALARDYAGLRGIGNEAWLTEDYWKDFAEYEKELDEWITDQRMIVVCTYPLMWRVPTSLPLPGDTDSGRFSNPPS